MAYPKNLTNRVKERRLGQGWSQGELAQRAGISRTAVSAIEMNRLVPSVGAALGLAAAFGCRVEDLFGSESPPTAEPRWAWPATRDPARFWHAQVADRVLLYPVEETPAGVLEHDGVVGEGKLQARSRVSPQETLVLAGCDPAAGLLAAEYARATGFRLLVLPRSSQEALNLLGQNLIHVAGVHLAAPEGTGNAPVAKARLGGGFTLVRAARWQEGLALREETSARSVAAVLRSSLSWVGREPGSGARQCLDELLAGRPAPRRLAFSHRAVAQAVRSGWADVGVCLRLAGEEAGLRFLAVREEAYEFCYPLRDEADRRLRGLVRVLRSATYRRLLGELPGYDASETGEAQTIR